MNKRDLVPEAEAPSFIFSNRSLFSDEAASNRGSSLPITLACLNPDSSAAGSTSCTLRKTFTCLSFSYMFVPSLSS